jgi:phosphate uptake regulator
MNDRQTPIERKVQLTGGSTYTVSIPKEWAGENEIEPGTHVELYERGEQLVVSATRAGENVHSTTVTAGERAPATVARSVAAAYVAGCEAVHIDQIQASKQRRAITRMIRQFAGLEVMAEDADSMTARTMLDAGTLSPDQTLDQIERTTLEMHAGAVDAVVDADREAGELVAAQDDDVDRLFALVARGFQQSLTDPAVTMGDGSLTSFEYYMAARQLERVADHAEKIAAIAGRLDETPPPETGQQLRDLSERARSVLKRALAGLLDAEATYDAVVAEADELLADIEQTDERLYDEGIDDGYLLGQVLDSIERTVQYGVNVAEAGVQASHRGGGML